MDFKSKYPAFFALIGLVAQAAKDVAADVESKASLLSAVLGAENLVPLLMQVYPAAGDIVSEAQAMSAEDLVSAGELLVSDLALSSDKAQAVIAAAFPLAESLAKIVPQSEALVAALKA